MELKKVEKDIKSGILWAETGSHGTVASVSAPLVTTVIFFFV